MREREQSSEGPTGPLGASQPPSNAMGLGRKAENQGQAGKQREGGQAAGQGGGVRERRRQMGKQERCQGEGCSSRGGCKRHYASRPLPPGAWGLSLLSFLHLGEVEAACRTFRLEAGVQRTQQESGELDNFLPWDLWEGKGFGHFVLC